MHIHPTGHKRTIQETLCATTNQHERIRLDKI